MTISKASEYLFLPDDDFRSLKPGHAKVLRSLAGRARVEWELATGENPFPEEPAASPRNPQNKLGHDHSGPPFGAAFRHPLATMNGRATTANIQGQRPAVEGVVEGSPFKVATWPITVRPFTPLPLPAIAPYSRLYFYFLAFTDAGTSTLTIKAKSRGGPLATEEFRSETFAITTTETAFTSSTDVLYVDVAPGFRQNRIIVSLEFHGSHASNEISITTLTLGQREKLTHPPP